MYITGVKRPPALLCSLKKDHIDLHSYEIAQTEPLHDFKNVIDRVLKELHYATDEKDLKISLTNILAELEGYCLNNTS